MRIDTDTCWEIIVPTSEGAHYTTMGLKQGANGMEALRELFPDGEADEMNLCLFSTSGVHGTYTTIEEVEAKEEGCDDVTFCIVQPRLVCIRYGIAAPLFADDFSFLKRLRKSSWDAALSIGRSDADVPSELKSTHNEVRSNEEVSVAAGMRVVPVETEEPWVIVKETLVEDIRNGTRPTLGYTLFEGARTFPTKEAVQSEMSKLNLPLGWVYGQLSQFLTVTEHIATPVAVGAVTDSERLEMERAAKEIYESWSAHPGYVPWVDCGNSSKQREARSIARRRASQRAEGGGV